MYKSTSSASSDIMNTIDGVDIYNSYYINELDKAPIIVIKVNPTITDRLDLLSKLVYSGNYKSSSGTLGIINRFIKSDTISELKYVNQDSLNSIVGY